MPELSVALEALRDLADEAAKAVSEPQRFKENEDHRQQALSQAVARARLLLGGQSAGAGRGIVEALLSDEAVEAANNAILAGGRTRDSIRAAMRVAGLDA